MASPASFPPEYNRAGALIFILYVVSALFLTGVILGTLYSPLSTHGSSKLLVVERQQKFSRKSSVQIYTALSVLSFSVLSYHMLSFLVLSYKTWASAGDIPIPQSVFGHEGLFDLQNATINIHAWQWLTSSTLFQDFAETICDDTARYWWTQQALLATMAWNFFMSIEGEKSISLLTSRYVEYTQDIWLILLNSISKPKEGKSELPGHSFFSARSSPSHSPKTSSS